MPLIFFTYPKKATTAGKWELLLADTLMEHVSVVETSAVDFSGYYLLDLGRLRRVSASDFAHLLSGFTVTASHGCDEG